MSTEIKVLFTAVVFIASYTFFLGLYSADQVEKNEIYTNTSAVTVEDQGFLTSLTSFYDYIKLLVNFTLDIPELSFINVIVFSSVGIILIYIIVRLIRGI